MTPRICPRCHSPLQSEDASSLVFCWNCGAPQIVLSEEFRDRLEQQQLAASSPSAAPASDFIADPAAILWPRAIQLAGLAGAAFIAICLLSAVVPPVSLIALLWLFSAPIVVLGVYASRNPQTKITTDFGAQLGLLCGLAIAFTGIVLNVAMLLIMRFGLHQGDKMDAQATTDTARLLKQWQLAPDQTVYIQTFLDKMRVPEFHVGYALAGVAMVFFVYVSYSAIAGAFAGFLRSRARPS